MPPPSVVTDCTFSGMMAVTEPSGLPGAVAPWLENCCNSTRFATVSGGASSSIEFRIGVTDRAGASPVVTVVMGRVGHTSSM